MHSDFLNTVAEKGLFHAVMRRACIGMRDQEELQARIIAGEHIDFSKEHHPVRAHYTEELNASQAELAAFNAMTDDERKAKYDEYMEKSKAHDAEFRSSIGDKGINLTAAKELFATWTEVPDALKDFHSSLAAEVEEAADIQIAPMPPERVLPTLDEWVSACRIDWQIHINRTQKQIDKITAQLNDYQAFLDALRASVLPFKKDA